MARISPEGLDRAQEWDCTPQGAAFAWGCLLVTSCILWLCNFQEYVVKVQMRNDPICIWFLVGGAVWRMWVLVTFVNLVQPKVSWGISWIRLTCGLVCKVSSQLLIDIEGPSLLWAIPLPRLMVPGCIRKSAELRPESKQASKQHPPRFLPSISFPGFQQMLNYDLEV